MVSNNFRLDTNQFPVQAFNASLHQYAADKSRCKHVLYVRQDEVSDSETASGSDATLSAKEKRKDKIASFRDAIRLPKRSVVEQRSEVIKILSEGIENYRQAFAYEIDPHLQAKLFGRSDYRDVTVSDLADLMRDIESKVTRLPDGFGKDAFSHEQWNRIVDAS